VPEVAERTTNVVVQVSVPPFAVAPGAAHPEQALVGEEVLRGFGASAVKSVALLSVSVQPLAPRRTAVVLLGAAVGAEPSKQFAVVPYPTKSMMLAPVGHDPVNAVWLLTKATFPAVADIAMIPVASGVGKF
jgi:hypothetical protein